MFLATAYGPRPAPNETMLLPSPVRPSTLGVVAADEQMSSSTHRRRNYPALTHSPQTFPSPLPRHEAKSPVLLPPPAFVTPIREGASDGAGPAYFPTPSSPTPSSPTPPRQVLEPGSGEFTRELSRWEANLSAAPALPDHCITGSSSSSTSTSSRDGSLIIMLSHDDSDGNHLGAVTGPASDTSARLSDDQLGGNRDVFSSADADQAFDPDSQHSARGSVDPMAQLLGAIQSSHSRCACPRRQIAHLKLDQREVDVGALMGAGTFGEVFSASMYGAVESTVVVKRIYRDDVTAEELYDAIDLMSHCAHPHVCGLVGYLENTGVPPIAVVFERASRSLFSCLHEARCAGGAVSMPDAQALDWSLQIASGIRYLQEVGGVYLRSLNSQNVLIFDEADDADDCYGDGEPDANAAERQILKISDYCSTMMFDHGLPSSQHIHKVAWMAPEVLNCKQPSHTADSWSMGIIMWEMLTGKLPFGDCDVGVMFSQICDGNTTALALPRSRPGFWGKMLAGCWHYRATKRTAVNQLLVVLGKHYSELQATDYSHVASRQQSFDDDGVGGVAASRHDYHQVVRQGSKDKSLLNRASEGIFKFMKLLKPKTARDSTGSPPHGAAAKTTRSTPEGARPEQSVVAGVADMRTPWELSATFGALNRRDAPLPRVAELTRRRVVMAGTGLASTGDTSRNPQFAAVKRKLTSGEIDFLHKANHSGRHKPLR